LGLSIDDLDFKRNKFRVRQQLQRVNGKLTAISPKTEESHRELHMIPIVRKLMLTAVKKAGIDPLTCYKIDAEYSTSRMLLTSSVDTPVDPKNFSRAFYLLISKAGLPRITVHTSRHIAATLMKNLGVPIKDAQRILGHASPLTTQLIYEHADEGIQQQAVNSIGGVLLTKENRSTSSYAPENDSNCYCQNNCQIDSGTPFQGDVNIRHSTNPPRITEVDSITDYGGAGGARTHDTGEPVK